MGNVCGSVEVLGDVLVFKPGLGSLGVSVSEPVDSTRCEFPRAELDVGGVGIFVDADVWYSLEHHDD